MTNMSPNAFIGCCKHIGQALTYKETTSFIKKHLSSKRHKGIIYNQIVIHRNTISLCTFKAGLNMLVTGFGVLVPMFLRVGLECVSFA